jgi:hypothetical protein
MPCTPASLDAHQVQPRAGTRIHALDRGAPHRIHRESFLGKQFVQPHEFLIDDPSGTDVFVPHFAVAHDAVRQADVEARRPDEGVRKLRMQAVVQLCASTTAWSRSAPGRVLAGHRE